MIGINYFVLLCYNYINNIILILILSTQFSDNCFFDNKYLYLIQTVSRVHNMECLISISNTDSRVHNMECLMAKQLLDLLDL